MAKLNRHEVIRQLAESSELSSEDVQRLLTSISQLATAHVADGFLVPGLGEFVLEVGPERTFRNPSDGEPMILPGKPVVAFIPDSSTSAQMLAQPANPRGDSPSCPGTVLPEIRLNPDASDLEAAQQNDRLSDAANHKLGGLPGWVQDHPIPRCCARDMTFYGQFDSGVGGEFNVMDAALILVFVCDYCSKPHAMVQSF